VAKFKAQKSDLKDRPKMDPMRTLFWAFLFLTETEYERSDRQKEQLPELPGAACPDKGNSPDVGDCPQDYQKSIKSRGVSDSGMSVWEKGSIQNE
jgi:hypothetical protein